MTIEHVAAEHPDRVAAVLAGTPQKLTFGELNERSARFAGLLHAHGLRQGDRLAVLMENELEQFVVAWAARRSGLRLVPVNRHLTFEEARYIVENSGSRALVVSSSLATLAQRIVAATPAVERVWVRGVATDNLESFDAAIAAAAPIAATDQCEGVYMFYSSGTTGQPKGILRPLPDHPFGRLSTFEQLLGALFGFDQHTIYLCPAPLYHAAPLGWSMGAQAHGGTAVLMSRFDAQEALAAIERHAVTHAQFVPTHFVRLLRLPAVIRQRFDPNGLTLVIHAGAPCAVEVKRQMLDWWGDRIVEFYSGSEGAGMTLIHAEEWRAHPGSVGRTIGPPIHIVNDDGEELPPGEVGTVYFENAERIEYHGEPEKTAGYFNDKGWGSLGDMGWLDADGYLYLADRKSHMIVSGGVNIYPAEIENALAAHPDVVDVAVIGVPNDEFGEEVKAVIVVAEPSRMGPALTRTLIDFCRERLAGFKIPRTIDYVDRLPRLENGKLLKRELRARYWL